jgi:SAM-dependent methyltransferase
MSHSGKPHHFNLAQPSNWERVDESVDSGFYQDPRLVVHVDEHFIAALGRFFAARLPPGGIILDLMSSYKSHLPAEYNPGFVVGHGMNELELQANDQLNQYFIQDLNLNPVLPFEDNHFDAVLNTVSVQYLRRPLEVFREVGRVLKPGGLHIVSFSNRMFPTKAVALWRNLAEPDRVALVQQYFEESGAFEPPQVFSEIDTRHHSGSIWASFYAAKDPIYIVWSVKKANLE